MAEDCCVVADPCALPQGMSSGGCPTDLQAALGPGRCQGTAVQSFWVPREQTAYFGCVFDPSWSASFGWAAVSRT